MMSTWHLSPWSCSGEHGLRSRDLSQPIRGQRLGPCDQSEPAPVRDLAECEVIFPTQSELSGLNCWELSLHWSVTMASNKHEVGGGRRTLISDILFAGGENWFRSRFRSLWPGSVVGGGARVMVWRRMGGGRERCRQGLLEPVNALLSNTKLTELSRD